MSHVEYPDVPDLILTIARTIRPMDWNDRVWRDQRERWEKSIKWRDWSIRMAYRIADVLCHPTQTMVVAGAEILEKEYETDTGIRDAHRIYVAMTRAIKQ